MTEYLKLHECRCDCHTIPNAKHCLPCCEICPVCQKQIKVVFIADHKKVCQSKDTHHATGDYPPHAPVMDVDDLDLAP